MAVEACFARGLSAGAPIGFTLVVALECRSLLLGGCVGCLSRWDDSGFALEFGSEAFGLVSVAGIAIVAAGFVAKPALHPLEFAVELARDVSSEVSVVAVAAAAGTVGLSCAHATLQAAIALSLNDCDRNYDRDEKAKHLLMVPLAQPRIGNRPSRVIPGGL